MSRVTKAAPAHTPGPWLSDERIVPWLGGEAPAVRVAHEREPGLWSPVCMVQPDQTGRYQPAGSLNPIADARLIAAAPTMLAALQACEENLRLIHEALGPVAKGAPMPTHSTFAAWQLASNAIAKALGGTELQSDTAASQSRRRAGVEDKR